MISKILFNNINNHFNYSKIISFNKKENNINNYSDKKNINSFPMDLKDKNQKIKKVSTYSFNKKTKSYYTNKFKKQISKHNMKNKSVTEQIFINVNQPLFIFNTSRSFDNRQYKYKNETNLYNKFITLTNKSIYINKILHNNKNINNSNQSQINITSFISDNSQNTILEAKFKRENITTKN